MRKTRKNTGEAQRMAGPEPNDVPMTQSEATGIGAALGRDRRESIRTRNSYPQDNILDGEMRAFGDGQGRGAATRPPRR